MYQVWYHISMPQILHVTDICKWFIWNSNVVGYHIFLLVKLALTLRNLLCSKCSKIQNLKVVLTEFKAFTLNLVCCCPFFSVVWIWTMWEKWRLGMWVSRAQSRYLVYASKITQQLTNSWMTLSGWSVGLGRGVCSGWQFKP